MWWLYIIWYFVVGLVVIMSGAMATYVTLSDIYTRATVDEKLESELSTAVNAKWYKIVLRVVIWPIFMPISMVQVAIELTRALEEEKLNIE